MAVEGFSNNNLRPDPNQIAKQVPPVAKGSENPKADNPNHQNQLADQSVRSSENLKRGDKLDISVSRSNGTFIKEQEAQNSKEQEKLKADRDAQLEELKQSRAEAAEKNALNNTSVEAQREASAEDAINKANQDADPKNQSGSSQGGSNNSGNQGLDLFA